MGRGQELLNLVKSIKQQKELQDIGQTISEQIKPENIKAGVEVFGVQGDNNIVDTSEGSATAANIAPGSIAFSKGVKITGAMRTTNSAAPLTINGNNKPINPENPYFILRRQYGGGSVFEELLKVNSAAIKAEWIEGKNIFLRYKLDKTTNTGILQLCATNWGNKFRFGNGNGEMYFSCINPSTNSGAPYQCWHCTVAKSDLPTLTADKWTGPVTYSQFGKTNSCDIYAYGRDDCIRTTGLEGSSGIPASYQTMTFEKNISTNVATYLANGAQEYNYASYTDIVDRIGLSNDQIVAGNTVLGLQGTAVELEPDLDFISNVVEKYSGPALVDVQTNYATSTTALSQNVNARKGKRIIACVGMSNNPSYSTSPATPKEIEGWELIHTVHSSKYNNWRQDTLCVFTKIAENETETFNLETMETCGRMSIILLAYDSDKQVQLINSVGGWLSSASYLDDIYIGDIVLNTYFGSSGTTIISGPKCDMYSSGGNTTIALIATTEADNFELDRTYQSAIATCILRFEREENPEKVLKAENIKKGVKILNVIGTLETTAEEEGPSKEELQARIAELEAEIAEANAIIDQLNGEEV